MLYLSDIIIMKMYAFNTDAFHFTKQILSINSQIDQNTVMMGNMIHNNPK